MDDFTDSSGYTALSVLRYFVADDFPVEGRDAILRDHPSLVGLAREWGWWDTEVREELAELGAQYLQQMKTRQEGEGNDG